MNRIIQLTIILTFGAGLTSCFGLFDSGSDEITGKYHVLWIDLEENQGVCEEINPNSGSYVELIPSYVFAVGHDDNFIIAKQHPTAGFKAGYKIDTELTNYYVIDMNRQILKKGDKVFGPLTKVQFDSIRSELRIEHTKFDLIYPDEL